MVINFTDIYDFYGLAREVLCFDTTWRGQHQYGIVTRTMGPQIGNGIGRNALPLM